LLCLLWVIAWTFFCGDTGLTAKDAAVIRKRRNGLQVQVYAGRDPLTGRKQWGQPPGPWTDQAVLPGSQEDRAELLEQVDRGQHRGSSSRTVAELIERLLSWRQQVRPAHPRPGRGVGGGAEQDQARI
jgi:hypothetical protein